MMLNGDGELISLPSVTVEGKALLELESQIYESLNEVSLEVTILYEGIERSYSSITEIVRDESVPELLETYEMLIQSKGGMARVNANSSQGDKHRLFVAGYDEWTSYMRRLLCGFFRERKNPIRSVFSGRRRMAPISLMSSIIAGHFFITISPLDIYDPAGHTLPRLYSIYFFSAIIFLCSSFRRSLFPYAYWDLRNGSGGDRYVLSGFEVVGLVSLTLLSLPLLNMLLN
ncbi:hypothetical protein DJ83_14985 [Halorubrum ezzemoulense]|uniref:Uncharacterized protein n=1 Tax=Halorubrum ezzemoulense TaxID=337243 RepID=A0A256IPB5_HALEZ|nr:hypothetical protein DJ83_14985 [Halorubrum ezzemoulense]